MPAAGERILVVGPAWVGDMVMAQSLFKAIKAADPRARIDVLAPDWSLPLLERMAEVNAGVRLAVRHGELGLATRYRVGRGLRGVGYHRAIVLPRSLKAALVPFFARIPRRTGYRGEMRYGLINDRRPLDRERLAQVVQRYVALGLEPGAPVPAAADLPRPRLRVDQANQARLLEELGLDLDRPVVGFVPGAEYGPAKRWPVEYFAEVARGLAQRGHHVWQFGSEKDAPVAGAIAALAPGATVNLCGRTRLEDVVDLIGATRAVLSNDSGLMHVAAAVGVPVAAVYGSSTPAYTPPLTDRARVLYLGLECSPCFKRECPLGHSRCLQDIRPERVLAALAELGTPGEKTEGEQG